MSRTYSLLLLVIGATLAAGCNSEEVTGGHGTPVDAQFVVGGAAATAELTLAAGQTVRVEIEYLDADGAHIHDLEAGHFASLTFSPAGLATVAAVSGEPFMFDVTAQATAGTGTVTVGYGHDAAADEDSFGPFTVTVQ
jgi:hypothetical protein